MKLDTLKDLNKIYEIYELNDYIDIRGETITGAVLVNTTENRLFLWKFSMDDVKDFIVIFNKLRRSTNRNVLNVFKSELTDKCRSMLRLGISPVECLLYSSKIINSLFRQNRALLIACADIIVTTVKNDDRCLSSLEHVIKSWNWKNQLGICILSCGKLKNRDLLDYVYRQFSNDIDLKFECCVALIDSQIAIFIDYILEIITVLDEQKNIDRQIANYFSKYFEMNFFEDGLRKVGNLLSNNKSLKVFQKKIFQKVYKEEFLVDDPNRLDFADIVKMAKAVAPTSNVVGDKKREYLSQLLQMLNSKKISQRANVIYALRFTDMEEVGEKLFQVFKNEKFTQSDIRTGLLTLGFLRCFQAKDYIIKFTKDVQLKYFALGALFLLGDKACIRQIAISVFSCDSHSIDNIIRVIKQVINYDKEYIKSEISNSMMEILGKNEENISSIALLNFRILVRDIKELYSHEVNEMLFNLLGFRDKQVKISFDNQLNIVNILNEIIDKHNSKNYENILFYLMDNNCNISTAVRTKAVTILKDSSKFPDAAPMI